MSSNSCPYCKEEINDSATVCKHCHASLQPTRKEKAIAAIGKLPPWPGIAKPSDSSCKAMCYERFASDKVRLRDCLNDCDAASALATVAERLQRELFDSFLEYIWAGGDIDPLPFENSIRERFSRGTHEDRKPNQ